MTRTKVKVIRPAPYSYQLAGHDLYTSYDLVAQGIVKPSVNLHQIPNQLFRAAEKATVITSNLARARETAQALHVNFNTCHAFDEINYKMSQIVTHNEFKELEPNEATRKARQLFFPRLFSDKLAESHAQLRKRTLVALKLLAQQRGAVMVVSHGFFMKFLEIAVLNPPAIYDIALFLKVYDGSFKSYEFLDGPVFSAAQLKKAIEFHDKRTHPI